MEENNCKYNTLVIIGNGFDLAHGYKTKYTDFVASVEENYFNNYISLLKLNRVNSDDWSDFENRVYEMAENFRQGELELSPNTDFADEFNSIFQDIQVRLIKYLDTEIKRKPFKKLKSIENCLDGNVLGLNFNYTNIAENYIDDIYYVHGSIDEGETVLGYDQMLTYCFTYYKNVKWHKRFSRRKLLFKRYLKEKLKNLRNEDLYTELCQDFDKVLEMEDSGKGLEIEDVRILKNSEHLIEYIQSDDFKKESQLDNFQFDNIDTIVVLGHGIKADITYLSSILENCSGLKKVIVFSHDSESCDEWQKKADFFKLYCNHIEKEMF